MGDLSKRREDLGKRWDYFLEGCFGIESREKKKGRALKKRKNISINDILRALQPVIDEDILDGIDIRMEYLADSEIEFHPGRYENHWNRDLIYTRQYIADNFPGTERYPCEVQEEMYSSDENRRIHLVITKYEAKANQQNEAIARCYIDFVLKKKGSAKYGPGGFDANAGKRK